MISNLELILYPDNRLLSVANPYKEVTNKDIELAKNMHTIMSQNHGIGLAAPQVGISKRLIVMHVPKEGSEERGYTDYLEGITGELITLFNPEIISTKGEIIYKEGCLSIPYIEAEVQRAQYIKVKGIDLNLNEVEYDLQNLEAVCMQHEIDHLNGILFIDYVSKLKKQRLLNKYNKLMKQKSDE